MTRRELIHSLSAGAALNWSSILAAQEHAHQMAAAGADASFEYLDAGIAAEIEALAAQIIPSGDSPGAREAGVIYFIDRALSTFDKDQRDFYTTGMRELQETRKAMFPGSASIASLSAQQQMQLLKTIETRTFFEVLRTHTMMGFFGDPSLGGNRGGVGWKLIGFEDKFQFEPPFGYYDGPEGKG